MPFLIVLGAGAVILGVGCIVAMIRTKRALQGVPNWDTITGTVLEAFVYRHTRRTTDETRITFTPRVKYMYEIAGEPYTSSKLDTLPYYVTSACDSAEAQTIIQKYPVDSAVTVYYNPNNPKQAMLKVPKAFANRTILLYGIVNVLLGGAIIALGIVLT
jgi:hypothetical protein